MYLNTHIDLKQHKINNIDDAYNHYINYGKNENRTLFKLIFDEQNTMNDSFIIDELYQLNNDTNQEINRLQQQKEIKEQEKKKELHKKNMLIKNENKELLNNKKISETLKIINEEDMTFFINHDWNMYLNTHRDLEQYKINNVEKAYLHYMNHGKKENREIFSLDIPSSNETIVVLNTTKENNIKEVCNIQEEYNFQEEHNIHIESKINKE